MSDKLFFRGTLILTFTGLASRIMGFFYRIFLSHTIGAQGVGIYQLTVHGIILAAAGMGIQAAISRLCASFTALEKEKESRNTLLLGMFLSGAVSLLLSAGVYLNADFIAGELLKEARTASLLRILSFSFPLSALHSCVNSFYYARKKNRTSSLYPAFGADFPDWQHLYDLPGTSIWWKRNHSHDCSWRCAF